MIDTHSTIWITTDTQARINVLKAALEAAEASIRRYRDMYLDTLNELTGEKNHRLAQVGELLEELTEARAIVGRQASQIYELEQKANALLSAEAHQQFAFEHYDRAIELFQRSIVKLGEKLEAAKKRADEAEHQVVVLRARQIKETKRANFAERRFALLSADLKRAERRATEADALVEQARNDSRAERERGDLFAKLYVRAELELLGAKMRARSHPFIGGVNHESRITGSKP